MKIKGCDECGVVVDLDKMYFPSPLYKKDGSVDTTRAIWDSYKEEFVAYLPCPVCSNPITEE